MGTKKPKQQPFRFAEEPKELFVGRDIPQADSLPRVRFVVAAVAAGIKTEAAFMDATGLSARHVLYYRSAAVTLGLLQEVPVLGVTPLGARVLSSEPESNEERELLLAAALGSRRLASFRDVFEKDEAPKKKELGFRIGQMVKLSMATAERRAGTLLSWRRYLLGEDAEVEVESHVETAKKIHEQIEAQNARAVEDYLQQLQTMNPTKFEKLVAELIKKMDYKLVKHVGGAGDGGVDVRALRDDKWGGEHKVVIQAKRYRKTVGRRFVHELIGVMDTEKVQEGLLITTGVFGKDALEVADGKKPALVLVDGRSLVMRLIEHEIGMKRDSHGALVPVQKATAGSKAKA